MTNTEYGYAVVSGEQVWGVGRTMGEAEERTNRWANAPKTYRIKSLSRAEYVRLTADRME